jgi:hypothetical protein
VDDSRNHESCIKVFHGNIFIALMLQTVVQQRLIAVNYLANNYTVTASNNNYNINKLLDIHNFFNV